MAGILGIAVIGSGSVGLPKNRLNKINLPKTDTSPNCPFLPFDDDFETPTVVSVQQL